MNTEFDFISSGKRTINIEKRAVEALSERIDSTFSTACTTILNCQGKVVVMGVGKSGHIGKKIAATLASTGTPAFFVHPTEASHGDFGMITKHDIVIAISNSGTSAEIINILPMLKRLGVTVISLSGNKESALATSSEVHIDISVDEEACPHNLAPTSSTTATIAMGDAIAIALLEAKGFSIEDFAFSHPGGNLGKKLLLRVYDVLHQDLLIPKTRSDATLIDAINEISTKKLGMTIIVDSNDKLLGIFTDGDLRRCVQSKIDIHSASISEVMTKSPRTILPTALAAEAMNLMEEWKITSLVVEDKNAKIVGVLHMHDLIRAGLI